MRATGPTAMARREWRRVTAVYAPLIEAALDQPQPTPELRGALARILEDPMLQQFMRQLRETVPARSSRDVHAREKASA